MKVMVCNLINIGVIDILKFCSIYSIYHIKNRIGKVMKSMNHFKITTLALFIFFNWIEISMAQNLIKSERWVYIADTVMGGVSEGSASLIDTPKGKAIKLSGKVSTQNNGGFIQVRVNMPKGVASEFTGIKLNVKGNGDEYFVHIRNSSSKLPWQYYAHNFKAKNEWQEIKLPFSEFSRSSRFIKKKMKIETIRSIGLVAYGKDYDADISILNVSFY